MELLSVDVLEFQNLISSTEPGRLERAASLYSGTLLGDLGIESEEFAVWLRATRARFEADFARVLDGLIDQRDAAGQGALAIAAAEQLSAIDPLREDWQRRLLRMMARHNCGTSALSHARSFIALLRKELDVDPEPATTALIEQIQRGDIEATGVEAISQPVPEAIDTIEPVVEPVLAFSPPTAFADLAAPAMPAYHAVSVPPQPVEPRWRLHPAASTSLIVFSTFSLTVGLMFLVWAYLMPLWGDETVGARMAAALPERSPIVVLPFESSAGKDSGAVAEQVSNDVIDSLSRVPNLKVISRLTSREYREPAAKDIAAIGAKLGVRYALHGSVQTEADKLNVNVELIDIASRLQVWSDRFEEDRPDRAAASDMIAKRLGRALQVEVINFQAEHRSANAPLAKAEIDLLVARAGPRSSAARTPMRWPRPKPFLAKHCGAIQNGWGQCSASPRMTPLPRRSRRPTCANGTEPKPTACWRA